MSGLRPRSQRLVAVEHAITASWQLLSTSTLYRDLGAGYYQRRAPAKTMRYVTKQAHEL